MHRLASQCVLIAVAGLLLAADLSGGPPAISAQPPDEDWVVAAAADAYTHASRPRTNFGSSRGLRLDASPRMRVYLRFEVPELDSPSPPDGVVLRVFAGDGLRSAVSVHETADSSWSEELLSYRNAPLPGRPVATRARVGSSRWVSFDVTSSVQEGQNVGFVLTTSAAGGGWLQSRETARAPHLLLSAESPEPSPSPSVTSTGPVIVAAAGDIACDPDGRDFNNGVGTRFACHQHQTANLVLSRNPDAVLALGDVQYMDGAPDEFERSYDLSWGAFKSITFPAVGNHEYQTPGASGYFGYFGETAGQPDKGYYSFDLGDWHLIALNSNCAEVGECGMGTPQETWLKADLASHSQVCTLAFWHHPRFSSGQQGGRDYYRVWWEDLYAAGVDLVLNGHDHNYERFAPQDPAGHADAELGIREFVVGTGGSNLYPFKEIAPNSEFRDNRNFGILELTLHATSYEWRFLRESDPSTPLDEGTAECH